MAKVFTITAGLENMGAMKTGGQGSVYKGRRIGEIVTAIKLLPTPIHSESAADKNFTSFQNEVQKLKKVNEKPNPNVVKILSSGITDSGNFPFIEMEFIEGPDLEDLLKPPHDPIFSIKEILKVADQLSHALAHCHKVDVRHGDIKSNNVKFNTHTGNYILLDFGLSVMSDEERRTSLRHAGAIEFMAPEQNEGQMLFQTDVYSFGVIMFELLGGTVPFPLKDKGETARNNVMVAHMETPPPNVLILRQQALPQSWSEQKKAAEMQVPDWLIKMIYRCLEKKPANRFANGMELHDFIWQNSIRTSVGIESTDEQVRFLKQENKKLLQDKERLQQQLLQLQSGLNTTNNIPLINQPNRTIDEPLPNNYGQKVSEPSLLSMKSFWLGLFVIIGVVALVYTLVKAGNKPNVKTPVNQSTKQRPVIAEYKVLAARAFFYNEPREATIRNAYATPSSAVVKAYEERNGFIYTEITNDRGQFSKGWLRTKDLIPFKDIPNANVAKPATQLNDKNLRKQLDEAKQFLASEQLPEALFMYRTLAQQQVPEAMYTYANLALQDRNESISCEQAFEYLISAANKGYTPAKRTLGFLYSFADDVDALKSNNYYERCSFGKNKSQGSQLLMEAMLQGDTTAGRMLNELNAKE